MSATTLNRTESPARRPRRIWRLLLGVLLILLVLMQVVRFVVPGLQIDNPPVTQRVAWDSPRTQELFAQACADCHSNETVWPWYAQVAPVAWLVAHDVQEGRDKLNISEETRFEWDEMVEEVREGKMPMPIYLPLHPEARLTDAQRLELIDGLEATFR